MSQKTIDEIIKEYTNEAVLCIADGVYSYPISHDQDDIYRNEQSFKQALLDRLLSLPELQTDFQPTTNSGADITNAKTANRIINYVRTALTRELGQEDK